MKKPKNASQSLMIKNAKKQKVSKNPSVRYPSKSELEQILNKKYTSR